MKADNKVMILGAGLSGLTLAYKLKQTGLDCLIIEARERTGGRISTLLASEDSTIEMGATWFADKHQSLIALIQELALPYEMQYVGDHMLYDFANPTRSTQRVPIPIGNEPSYIFSSGSRSLIDNITDQLDETSIHLGEEVHSITILDDSCEVKTSVATYTADHIVSTLPPALFENKVVVAPDLPSDVISLLQNTHTWMGESIKVGIAYKEAFWRTHQIGTFFSQFGPIQELHDHIHHGQQRPILKGFLHPHFRNLSLEGLTEAIHQQMQFYFGVDVERPVDIYLTDWEAESHTYIPYQGYVGPHQNNGHAALRFPYFEGRLIFGGSETASQFPGYMDGAVERANEVAQWLIDKN